MPAIRKALELRHEEKSFVVRFKHPISKKVLRIWLGTYPTESQIAQERLDKLNAVFLDQTQWINPKGLPEDLARIWNNAALGVKVQGGKVSVNGEDIPLTAGKAAELMAVIEKLQQQLTTERQENAKLRKQLEAVMGRKIRTGVCPTLDAALKNWKEGYRGRDSEHTKIVCYDLERFVNKFGPETLVDDLDNAEKRIDDWLRSLTVKRKDETLPAKPISAGRRAQIRRHVLRFLEDSGLNLRRKAIATPGRKEVRKDRGAVRYLEVEQADELVKHLPALWADAFTIQREIGLRPSEVATLKKSDFTADLATLKLSPLGALTLKTGSRTINLNNFPNVRPAIERLFSAAAGDPLFTENGAPWIDHRFMKAYNTALKAAKDKVNEAAKAPGSEALNIGFKIDCRIGRRTCASLLIRDKRDKRGRIYQKGRNIESVAALLGDDPATIREHYGHLQSHEV